MDINKIVRAWRDVDYRESLSEAEQAFLPDNPAELIDLDDTEMDTVAGGTSIPTLWPWYSFCVRTSVCGSCPMFTDGCC